MAADEHKVIFSMVEWFPGPYSDYLADRRSRLGDAAGRPHRVTYRPLTRS